MVKRNLLIGAVVILLGLSGWLVFSLVSSTNDQSLTANVSGALGRFNAPSKNSNTAPALHLVRISSVPALGVGLSADGRAVIYFDKNSNRLTQSDFTGTQTSALPVTLTGKVNDATWSSNGKDGIASYLSGASKKYVYINLRDNQLTKLADNIIAPTFSTSGDRVTYLYHEANTGRGNISIANPDGSDFKIVLSTRNLDLAINWPRAGEIAFYNPRQIGSGIFLLDIATHQLKNITPDMNPAGMVDGMSWSPNGEKLIYSEQVEDERTLYILNANTSGRDLLDFTSRPDKCVWSLNSQLLYCGGRLTGDKADSLFQIDLASKAIKQLTDPLVADQINIFKPIISPAEDYIIFTNQNDGYLYSIKLP